MVEKNEKRAEEVVAKYLAKNHPDNRARMARRMVRANMVKASQEYNYMLSDDIDDKLDLCS